MTFDPIEAKLALYRPAAPMPDLQDRIVETVLCRAARRSTMRVLVVAFAALLLSGAIAATRSWLWRPPEPERQSVLAMVGPAGGSSIDIGVFRNADVVCTGIATATRPVDVETPLWRKWQGGADMVTYEADFAVDRIIKGAASIVGETIHIQYPAFKSGTQVVRTGPLTFGEVFAIGERYVVCLAADVRKKNTYVIMYGRGYCPVGQRREVQGWDKLTPEQRIAHELVASIQDENKDISLSAMRSAGAMRISTPELISALRSRSTDPDASVASRAITALLQLNDLPTIYALPDTVSRGQPDSGKVGGLYEVTDPDAVPALVALACLEDNRIRKGAVYALRQSKSRNAASALAAALNDPDEDVHYQAVMGLYSIRHAEEKTGWYKPGEGWAPSLDLFRQDPQKTLRKWKQWWEEEGKAKHPSVDAVLKLYEEKKAELEDTEEP